MKNFDTALAAFVLALQAAVTAQCATRYPGRAVDTITTNHDLNGFVRVVHGWPGHGRAAYCFIERATGNTFLPVNWRRAHPGVTGNIYTGAA